MILFVGSVQESYFAKKICQKREDEFQLLELNSELQYMVNDIIRTNCNILILDVAQYADDIVNIIDSTEKIVDAINCKVIIVAKGFLPGSKLVQAYYNAGYTDFILNPVLSFAQEELINCLDGYYIKNGVAPEIVAAAETIKKENPKKEDDITLREIKAAQRKKISIAVAGAKHFIGTTTQVVQIAKYYMQANQKTAIVEINSSNYFFKLKNMEEESSYRFDSGISLLEYKGLDIFLDPSQLSKNIRQKYDVLIYDYGCFFDSDFQRISYYEKDILCLVGGNKVNEYAATNQALKENLKKENMYYLFSFISKNDASYLLKSMQQLSERTIFPEYTPDMFVFNPDNNYEKFFKYTLKKKESKGAFSFFRKKRK